MEVITHAKDRVLSVDNVLTKNECESLIEITEKIGFKPSALSGGGRGRTGREGARTSQFCVWDCKESEELSDKLWAINSCH